MSLPVSAYQVYLIWYHSLLLKRINTKRKQSKQKKQEDIDTKRHEDEEDALLWSHFDDWDWDTILPLIP